MEAGTSPHRPMKRALLLTLGIFAAAVAGAKELKLACVGDSITQGSGLKKPGAESYPARLQVLLGKEWTVGNFGVSGRTMQQAGDHPYRKEKAFTRALEFAPDVVTLKLGTNDSKPHNWNPARYEADARALITVFQKLPSHPRVIVCLPVPVFQADQWGIRAAVVEKEILPILRKVARETGAELVDLHTPCLGDTAFYPDTVHPNAAGHAHIAELLAAYLKRPAPPAATPAANS